MDFQRESVEKAREIARTYKKRTRSKLEQSANLYDGHFLELNYGFSEDIKQGCCGRYFHEVGKEVECFTKAAIDYLIARELALDPKFYWISQMKDLADGEDPSDKGTLEHSFITVQTEKKQRYIIDRQMGVFGKIRFNPKENKIEIVNMKKGTVTTRTYSLLTELSEKEIIKKIEKDRSPEGGRLILSAPQRLTLDGFYIFIEYNPKDQTFCSRIQNQRIASSVEQYKKGAVTELRAHVNPNGSFDFKNGEFSFFNVVGTGWTEHNCPQTKMSYSAQNALKLFNIWQEIMKKRGRKSDIRKIKENRLIGELEDLGFSTRFLLKKGSIAEEVVTEKNLYEDLKAIQEEKEKRIREFLPKCREHEISYKVHLRDTKYTLLQDRVRCQDNPRAFVFSLEKHEKLLEEEYQRYNEETSHLNKILAEKAKIRARFKKGSRYNSNRSTNANIERTIKKITFFEELADLRWDSYKPSFNMVADIMLFNRQFDLENRTISELEKGISEEDLLRGAEERLFFSLVRTNAYKKALFISSFKRGIQKILDTTKD